MSLRAGAPRSPCSGTGGGWRLASATGVPQLRLLHHADPPTPPDALPQNKLFGSLVGSAACTVQLELRPSGAAAAAAGGVQPSVTLKNRRDELETMPLFSSKDTISGEVRGGPKLPQSSCERRAAAPPSVAGPPLQRSDSTPNRMPCRRRSR